MDPILIIAAAMAILGLMTIVLVYSMSIPREKNDPISDKQPEPSLDHAQSAQSELSDAGMAPDPESAGQSPPEPE
jgi:hypothetical protein